ncbi:MAG: glycoside hydrolase family 10 protein [bacterium]|jgi:uncharacterized lipoprotein YddW (UPF0748 family)
MKKLRQLVRVGVFSILYITLVTLCAYSAETKRALWVTRWDFKNADDIARIMANAHDLGVKQVLFQIRGNATVFYPSRIEPWAWELTGKDATTVGVDPGWDPLTVALREGQKYGLEIHGWMNVFPAWRGTINPPGTLRHPWVNHKDWFMRDHLNKLMQPTASWYNFLSPGNTAVRSYLASVFAEVAQNYPSLAGLHMDYVRYPANRELGSYRNFSFDSESIKNFKKLYGYTPTDQSPDWSTFKCDQVTQSIRAIRSAMRKVAPRMELSGTFMAEIGKANQETGQDPLRWLDENLVDWAVPMAYQRNTSALSKTLDELQFMLPVNIHEKMVIGLNVDFNAAAEISNQMNLTYSQHWGGEALFAYSSLFPGHKANAKAKTIKSLWQKNVRQLTPPASLAEVKELQRALIKDAVSSVKR